MRCFHYPEFGQLRKRGKYLTLTLMECTGSFVADALASDLCNFETGNVHDELQWLDVALHACRILNANENVIFVTSAQLQIAGSLIKHAEADGYRVIVVPQTIAAKLSTLKDINGELVRDVGRYGEEWNNSFAFTFVAPDELTQKEKAIFALTEQIVQFAGKQRTRFIKQVLISETMRLTAYGTHEAAGLWCEEDGRIIIKRSELCTSQSYAATLLHEITHAFTQADDLTQTFENGLTEMLGLLAVNTFK